MTALARYERDRRLPARAGQPDLVLPEDAELLERHGAHLARLLDGPATSLELLHARWKPGVAVAGTWRVGTADGGSALVTLKRHRGAKAQGRAEAAGALATRDAAGEVLLFRPDADHHLPGLARLFDPEGKRRLARCLREAGALGPESLRKRRTSFELLRYKPERRAVLRLEVHTRDADGGRHHRTMGLRVHAPARAELIAANRRRLLGPTPPAWLPPLLAHEPRAGWLLEPWLDGRIDEQGARAAAGEVGAILSRLHALPLPEGVGAARSTAREAPPMELRAASPLLATLASDLLRNQGERGPRRPPVLAHGDLHADQVLMRDGRAVALLDLDELGPADPHQDLASWVADELVLDRGLELEAAARPLLAGYGRVEAADLAPAVCRALIARAAAGLRRLQVDALPRAAALISRAQGVLR